MSDGSEGDETKLDVEVLGVAEEALEYRSEPTM